MVALQKSFQALKACLNFLLEYTRVFSGQSREGRHPYAPWILINNPSSQEVEGLPLHRAPLQLWMIPPPFKMYPPPEKWFLKKIQISKTVLISVVQFFYLFFGCPMTNFGSLLRKHLIHPISSHVGIYSLSHKKKLTIFDLACICKILFRKTE